MKDYDPAIHTAEHILNRTVDTMLGCGRAFTAHVERRKCKCDYRAGRDLSPDEPRELERRVNEVIRQDLPVTEEFVSRDEAGKRFSLTRLPEAAGDTVRIVRVGEYDECPCSGAHIDRTGKIGEDSIVSTSFENGVLRLRWKVRSPEE